MRIFERDRIVLPNSIACDMIASKGVNSMDDIQLTKRARILMDELFHEFTRRENEDVSRFEARLFGGVEEIQSNWLQTWREDDISDICEELADNGLLNILPGDDTVQMLWLTDAGIAWGENEGSRKRAAFWKAVERIRSFLPW